jgi:rod shape-determining protein MreC
LGLGRWRFALIGPLCLVLAGVIFLTTGQRASLSWPEWALREAVAPLQSGVSRVTRGAEGAVRGLVGLFHLANENARLRQELEQLRAERAELLEAQRENESLRQLLQLQRDSRLEMVAAEVIARTPSHWFSALTINKGSLHGVGKGMAVVAADGVVGHVRTVTAHTAEVLLIIDPKSALGGRIYRTGDVVLVEGLGAPGGGRALVKPLAREVDLRKDDYVVTAGLSEIYPKGLPVGVVEEVQEAKYGLTKYGVLRPAVDMDRLEWVAVITAWNKAGSKGGTASGRR